ncbi:uncharacterized protein MELLADRAFT_92255 [Melampsora larici-populina 98AG31]|uniref:Secreted protein n=1 Tax=Melampsora larici-populina (strain 98AG31 / pathotype 3-4-7) TaxID=747676 RepID=F4R8Z1_MELLP|nr:uncharacterized protein MELLADRAFT_92255 [Melampsora larici-populina 98AG31]EGG10894.1 secreted protein [Melampsora larici-populina 98AG31]
MLTDKSIKLFQYVTIFLAFSTYQFTSGKFILTPTGNAKVPNPSEQPDNHNTISAGPPVGHKPSPIVDGSQVCSQGFGQRHTPKGNFSVKAGQEDTTPCQTKDAVFMCLPSSCHSQDRKPHASASGCEGASGPTQCLAYSFKPEVQTKKPSEPPHPKPVQSSPAPRNASHTIKTRAEPEHKDKSSAVKSPLECVISSEPLKSAGCQKMDSVVECTKCQKIAV